VLSLSEVCGNFAVHGATQITFAGSKITGGDVGTPPGTAISGIYSISEGEVEAGDSSVFDATAIEAWQEGMRVRAGHFPITTTDIGGLTFTPGTHRAVTSITIGAGKNIIFDGEGNETSTFLIQAGTTMAVGSGVDMTLTGGAKAENIVWAIGTNLATGAGSNLKGSFMAGTSITFGANTVLDGSILALTAITLGAGCEVNGCMVALTAITFGAMNSVTFGHQEEIADPGGFSAPVSYIDFPELANGNDQLTIACMPQLDEETPVACEIYNIFDHMQSMLNDCTTVGIFNALASDTFVARRRTSRSDILQVQGEISMHALASLDGEDRSVRGVGQEERRLRRRMCRTTRPSLMRILLCCWKTNAYSYCGSPTNTNRRELQSTVVVEPSPRRLYVAAAQVEQYLPEISAECTSQFQALAQNFINKDSAAECFASAADVPDLTCYAIMVTGGAE
jgi:hypothetical protein